MNLPWVYKCSPCWTLLAPPSPYHPSESSQWISPKHPVSCIKAGLVICFFYDIIHVSMPFSQIVPPSPSPTESKRLFYTSVSLLLSHIQGYHDHLCKFHIHLLVYCIGVFLAGLAWTCGISQFTYCWSLAWRILSITLLACEMSAIVGYFENSLALPLGQNTLQRSFFFFFHVSL